MPSLAHHALVDLFREQPTLVPRLLEAVLGVRMPRGAACRVGDSNLDRLRPVERRADLVLELSRRGRPLLSIVVEVQRRPDARKWLAWLDYMLARRPRSRVCVLVVATDARVAAWAARPFDLGPGNESLRVWVLGPDQIVPVLDPEVARQAPELAFLSALTHASTQPATLAAAVACFPDLPDDLVELYYAVLDQHLPARLRPTLEAHTMNVMAKYNLSESPLRKLLQKLARKQAEEEVKETKKQIRREAQVALKEAKTKARMEARIEAEVALKEATTKAEIALKASREAASLFRLDERRAILLRLMKKAGLELSDAQRRRVERCSEARQLDTWIDRVLTAETAREVFATTRPKHSPPKITKRAAAPKRTRRPAA